jgi:transposase
METVAWTYVREELCITPAKLERVRYLQEVLACPVCREEDEGTFTKAPTPAPLLAHSPASPSMVAYVMYQKFMNSVPFYRQEMDWLQKGAPLQGKQQQTGASNAHLNISSQSMTFFMSIF